MMEKLLSRILDKILPRWSPLMFKATLISLVAAAFVIPLVFAATPFIEFFNGMAAQPKGKAQMTHGRTYGEAWLVTRDPVPGTIARSQYPYVFDHLGKAGGAESGATESPTGVSTVATGSTTGVSTGAPPGVTGETASAAENAAALTAPLSTGGELAADPAAAAAAEAAKRELENARLVGTRLENPLPVTAEALARGQERYDVFCIVCHGPKGQGDGPATGSDPVTGNKRFPIPPSLHTDQARQYEDGTIFHIITKGLGQMPSYADKLPPDDRWKVILYLRALQRAMNPKPEDLPQ